MKRTESDSLIKIVNELCEGSLSDESDKYIRSLSRPIQNPHLATRLFSTNLDCAFVNHDMLIADEPQDEIKHFKANDNGRKASLIKLKNPQISFSQN